MAARDRAKTNKRKKIKRKFNGKKQVYYGGANNNDIGERVDQLSLLPDDILVNILSRLPISDALTTGLLSQRWRYLWTLITSLNIVHIYRRKEFFTEILPQFTNIHRITINYKWVILDETEYLGPLYCQLFGWNIHEVKVLSIYATQVSEHTTFINQIFQLSLFQVLELKYNGFLNRDVVDELALPTSMNLKVLKLRFDYDDYNHVLLLNKIFKSCPLIEDLSFTIECDGKSKKKKPYWFWYSFRDKTTFSKLMIIDAPNVKYLKLDHFHLSKLFFASNITSLQKVDLSGEFGALDVERQSSQLMNIFQVISKARSLSLGSPSLVTDAPRMPVFASLVHLKCIVNCSVEGTINLLALLEKCPLLEVLILHFTPHFFGFKKHSETLQCDLKPVNLVSLKRVEMKMRLHLLDGGAFYTVKYLLDSASVLELLIVNVSSHKIGFTEVAQSHELQVAEDILALPRKSLLCKVEYFGMSLKFSDFERKLY